MRTALLIVAAGVVALGATLALAPSGRGAFRAWLEEVRDGDADRGWHLLGAEAQRAYAGDADAYARDVDGADWGALELDPPADQWTDDGFTHVVTPLRSSPATVPEFLFGRRIVHAVCDGDVPAGIGAYEDRRPFGGWGFGSGGVTGSQRGCQAAFRTAAP